MRVASEFSCISSLPSYYRSDHRFDVNNGLLNFWAHIADTVAYRDDNIKEIVATQSHLTEVVKKNKPVKRAICSCCGAHLAYVYEDGPYPFYKRFTASCASLDFKQRKHWPAPEIVPLYKRLYRSELAKLVEAKKANDAKVEKMFSLVDVNKIK